MSRAAHILKELRRNLGRNPGTVAGSFLSLMLLYLLFDLYWMAALTSKRYYDQMLAQLQMEAFVSEDVPDSSLAAVQTGIAASPGVRSVEFVSREDARGELAELVGIDLLAGYDSANPLPRSFVLDFTHDHLTSERMAAYAHELEGTADISQVYYSRKWLEKAESTREAFQNIGLALGAVILLAALISTVSNIRLSSRARAVGFQQMRLLGAGRLFLAAPFLIESFLIGGFSALAGWSVVWCARQQITLTQLELVLPTGEEIVYYCGATAVLGIVSGYFGIRKLLK